MKYLIYTLIYSACFFNLNAQNCLPDSIYRDSAAGVYPRPVSMDYPNGGIHKKACINKPYDFTFTVVVPDSILIPLSPTPVPLEQVAIDTAGAISNLPVGITYACNPPNCVYKKNTFGCLILKGIPDDTNVPGDYKPVIHMKVTVNIGFPLTVPADYPGPIAPGEYILTLLSENDCALSTDNQNIKTNFWFPNPTNGYINSTASHIEKVKIFNLNGKLIYSEEMVMNKELDLTSLNTQGMHFIYWIENNQAFVQKIMLGKF